MAELITTEQAAAILGVKPDTLVQWRHHGRQPDLRFVKVGRSVKYDPADVQRFIEKNKGRAA